MPASGQWIRSIVTACFVVVALWVWESAVAGPLEDAQDADDRGDYAVELRLVQPLAYAGNARAQYLLGEMYVYGKGMPLSNAEAARWYRLSARQGDDQGQTALGTMYDAGLGVPRSYVEAIKWWRFAAVQGNALAQSDLGSMYDLGHGVPQDYAEAVKWYSRAAAQGSAMAQLALGEKYELGQGVPRDLVLSYMWYSLSAANGPNPRSWILTEAVNKQDRLISQMTWAQIAAARKLAREWKPIFPTQQAIVAPPSQPQSPLSSQTTSGSGLFVSEIGDVLTNAHVVEGCKTAEVTAQGTVTTARIIARDAKIDLALLKVPLRSPAAASLRQTVRQGESVFAYGFPLPGLLSSGGNFTTGAVTALAGLHDDSRSLQISVPVQPGNSGGPLVDEAANVVGIVVAKLDALKVAQATDDMPQNVNFAIKATVAADFLSAHDVRYVEGKLVGPPLPSGDIAQSLTRNHAATL